MDTGHTQPESSPAPPAPAALAVESARCGDGAAAVGAKAASSSDSKAEPSFRRFFESAILFICAVILLRSIAIEPFGVPTGSMAMTLAGNHKACSCPRCNYPVLVGTAGATGVAAPGKNSVSTTGWCPNCGLSDIGLDQIAETVGDRLLVDKNIFEMRRPRRWEIAVFRCPSDYSKPYVKRVVGLPGESVQIRNGDVYINGEIARKSLEECRAVRVLHLDHSFQPAAGGWRSRWYLPASENSGNLNKSPASADEYLDGATLRWPASSANSTALRWVGYRQWLLDEKREESIRDQFAYNGAHHHHELKNVHDFFVEFDVEVSGSSGEIAVALTDGKDRVTATLPVRTPGVELVSAARITDTTGAVLAQSEASALVDGRTYHVEMSFFDRRVALAVDGVELVGPIDLPAAGTRKPVSRPLQLGVRGVAAAIKNLRIFRDVHYAPTGRNGIHEPWPLAADEYFLLGDNSSNSEDSRYWSIPGVPEANFLGRPLLLHQPSRWVTFGDGWGVQSIDWGRVRWIR